MTDANLPHLDVRVHLFEALRVGGVPDAGLDTFAALDTAIDEAIDALLDTPNGRGGAARMIRGGFGTGKTFTLKLALERARARRYVTSLVAVDETLVGLHQPERLYRAVVSGLRSRGAASGGLLELIDQRLGSLRADLDRNEPRQGADAATRGSTPAPDAQAGAALVDAFEADLVRHAIGAGRTDIRAALVGLARARVDGDAASVWALTGWLAGSDNVSSRALRACNVRGRLGPDDVEPALRDITTLAAVAGARGVAIGIDEVASVLRLGTEQRQRSWELVLTILDRWRGWPNTLWLLAGTPEVFESPRGVAGFEPLRQRVALVDGSGVESVRQAQLALPALDHARLASIVARLATLYPGGAGSRVADYANEEAAARVVAALAPATLDNTRSFMRALCHLFDAVEAGQTPAWETAERAAATPSHIDDASAVAGAAAAEANEAGPPDDAAADGRPDAIAPSPDAGPLAPLVGARTVW